MRESLGLSQESWGERIHFSASHVGAVERGERPALPDYLGPVDRVYRTGLLDFYQEFVLGEKSPVWLRPWLEYEREASMLRYFELAVLPGPFQTEGYARALIGTTKSGVALEEAVAVRMAQGEILRREDPPRVVAVLDEGLLYRPVGGAAVMHEQLRAVVDACSLPHVSVFVVPSHVGAYAGLDGPIGLATVHGRTVGVKDGPGEGTVVEDQAGMAVLERHWEAVREYALPQGASLELLRKAMESWT
ncbi:helix-turn-helix transcriptional regulator [Micromonospora sp. WMMD1102]|uniref:helix-turn-helix domain-containing protein n=1 Tax=Micromonospora sp. WMMD1102 TaxID=3016105 RepID=UPI002415509D|nr:helix-turn-helix transcriptional regulator [Micromonospora sp. WMMD1102]MDG4789460.1 helix-turn-helix transcriptional regulator [Micromonospora sp. WMMD1102]